MKKSSASNNGFEKRPQDINKNGRPAGSRNYATEMKDAIKVLADMKGKTVDEMERELLASGFGRAFKDFRFFKEHLDRTFGKPKEEVEHKFDPNMPLYVITDAKPIRGDTVQSEAASESDK